MSRPKTPSVGRRALGEALRERREQAGWSLRELASRTELSYTYLSQCENAERAITLEALVPIARAYGVLVTDLLQGVFPFGATGPADLP